MADYETTIWLNGEVTGTNRGRYLPFRIDAIDALWLGRNVIIARVRDPEGPLEDTLREAGRSVVHSGQRDLVGFGMG